MKTVIVACKRIEDELEFAMKNTGSSYPVLWVEGELHNTPSKLTDRLNEVIYEADADRVLMGFGFCGNSVRGIRAGKSELIIPRVDDCISLLLGSVKKRMKLSSDLAAFYLTESWMRSEDNLWKEYQASIEKYGEEDAMYIMDTQLAHYRTLGLLDCGAKPLDSFIESTKIIAEIFKLEQLVIPATLSYIEQLLTGPWPECGFLVKPPGVSIEMEDLVVFY